VRPHVELIQQDDLVWHDDAELPKGSGRVIQRNLSYDEENGAASTKLHFKTDWSRPAGYHEADTEWYILDGEAKFGDQMLRKGAYFRVPAGKMVPEIQVKEGTDILVFREYGDWGFSVSEKDRSDFIPQGGNTVSKKPGEITMIDTFSMKWMPNIFEGDTQWELMLKMLYRDPPDPENNRTGFVTMLAWAPPGWGDDRLVHHPVFEEAYTIYGDMDYNFGRIDTGTYFFRPAMVKHGHFSSGMDRGAAWIFRLDGSLINWITVEEDVIIKGRPLNYDPKTQAPVMAGIPVRSRSTGDWDLDGQ